MVSMAFAGDGKEGVPVDAECDQDNFDEYLQLVCKHVHSSVRLRVPSFAQESW